MKIIVAKEQKRLWEEGKATVFYTMALNYPWRKLRFWRKKRFLESRIQLHLVHVSHIRHSQPFWAHYLHLLVTPAAVTYFSPRDDAINGESGDDLKHLLSSTSARQSEKDVRQILRLWRRPGWIRVKPHRKSICDYASQVVFQDHIQYLQYDLVH